MSDRIMQMYQKYKHIIVYLFFGVLTTAVNWCVYFPLHNWLSFSATVANVIAWCVSVVFAFFTNKRFVFHSLQWSPAVVVPELLKFIGCRVGSGLLESAFMFVTVDCMHSDGNVMKVIISVVVVLVNYIGSKWLFRSK